MRMRPAIPAAIPGFWHEVMGTSSSIFNYVPPPQVCAYPQPKERRAKSRFQKNHIIVTIITLKLYCLCSWGCLSSFGRIEHMLIQY